jgi:hypothetical protein
MSTQEKLVDYKIAIMCKKALDWTYKLGITQIDSMNLSVKLLNLEIFKKKKNNKKIILYNLRIFNSPMFCIIVKRLHVDTPNENSSCVKSTLKVTKANVRLKFHLKEYYGNYTF